MLFCVFFWFVSQADLSLYNEFRSWKDEPTMDRTCPFLDKIYQEDIFPCLTFSKSEVIEKTLYRNTFEFVFFSTSYFIV